VVDQPNGFAPQLHIEEIDLLSQQDIEPFLKELGV
jgi:hypothetical protein